MNNTCSLGRRGLSAALSRCQLPCVSTMLGNKVRQHMKKLQNLSLCTLERTGRSTWPQASSMKPASCANSARVKKEALEVMRNAEVRKSWLAQMSTSPLFGVRKFAVVPINWIASALASCMKTHGLPASIAVGCARMRQQVPKLCSAFANSERHGLMKLLAQAICEGQCQQHDHARTCARLCLGQVDVHLIAIKVSIEGVAHALIEAQRAARHDARAQRHDAHTVQARLPVEQHNVAIIQVTLHHIAHLWSIP
jgi:hypothetical protein